MMCCCTSTHTYHSSLDKTTICI